LKIYIKITKSSCENASRKASFPNYSPLYCFAVYSAGSTFTATIQASAMLKSRGVNGQRNIVAR
jgi:hypothetical protein